MKSTPKDMAFLVHHPRIMGIRHRFAWTWSDDAGEWLPDLDHTLTLTILRGVISGFRALEMSHFSEDINGWIWLVRVDGAAQPFQGHSEGDAIVQALLAQLREPGAPHG